MRSQDSWSSASSVDLKLTHLDWDAESALIHFQGQHLNICEADYSILTTEIQCFPKANTVVEVGEIYLVKDRNSAQWFRGRVQNREESLYDVLLIDQGNIVTVDASCISSCPKKLLILPPKLICGFLADVLLFQNCSQSSVDKFFSNLISKNFTGFVHGFLPHHVILLEAPDINRDLVQHGFGRHVDSSTFLCLVKMITGIAIEQKSDPLTGQQRGRPLLQRYRDFMSVCGPRLPCGTEVEVQVTAAFDLGLFYCRTISGEADLCKMSTKLGALCEDEQKIQQSLDELCAVQGKDEKWYRGFFLFPPIQGHVEVFLIDCGYFETVREERVHKLPSLGFNSAPLAFPCRLASVTDGDEKAFKAGLLGAVLAVKVNGFHKEQFLHTITITGIKYDLFKDPQPSDKQSFDPSPLSPLKDVQLDGTFMQELLSQTLAEEKIRDGSAFEGYVLHAKDPENFWVVSANRQDECQEMTTRMIEHFEKLKLYEDVLVNPKPGSMCSALYEVDMRFYRAMVLNNLSYGAEVLFIDYGNIGKVPHIAIKTLPETFSSKPAFAICCSLENVVPPEDIWTTKSCEFFRKAVMDRTLLIHVVQVTKHKVVVNLFRKESHTSIAELLATSKLAIYISMVPKSKQKESSFMSSTRKTHMNKIKKPQYVGRKHFKNPADHVKAPSSFTALRLMPGSQFPVCCTHINSSSVFWCQPLDKVPALDQLMLEIQQYYSNKRIPFQPGDRCCVVRSPLDDRWYRGAVVEEKRDTFRVTLVDCGPTLQVKEDRLQGLKPEYFGLERQAFQCSLFNPLSPPDSSHGGPEAATDMLRAFVLDCPGHLECKLVSLLKVKGEGLSYVVQLYNTLTHQCVNSKLVELSLSKDKSEPTAPPKSFVYSAFGLSAGKKEEVHVTHVTSQSEVYCQLSKNKDVITELDRVAAELGESGQPGDWDRVQKKLCLAKYLDGRWYRCVVLHASAPPYVWVFFVDYGNTYICEKNNIFVIPEACRSLLYTPMQALRCNLVSVSNHPLCADAKGWLMDATLDKSITALVWERRKDGSVDVEMFDENINVNQKVMELLSKLSSNPASSTNGKKENHHSKRSSKNPERKKTLSASKPSSNLLLKDETKDLKKAKEKTEHKKKIKSLSNAKKQRGNPIPSPQQTHGEEKRLLLLTPSINSNIGPGFRTKGFISYFTSVSNFFLQLSEDKAVILKMCKDLNSDAFRNSLKCVSFVRNGDMVLAEFKEDGALYRSVVQSQEGSSFGVDFIDFGNSAVVGKKKVFALPEEHRRQHRLSMPCSLLDANTYTGDAVFAEAMLTTTLMVEFVCQNGLQWQVRIQILDQKDQPEDDIECQNKTRPPSFPGEQTSLCEDAEEQFQNQPPAEEPFPGSTIKAGDTGTGMVLPVQSGGSLKNQDVLSEKSTDQDLNRLKTVRLDCEVQVQNNHRLQNVDEDIFPLDQRNPAQQQWDDPPHLPQPPQLPHLPEPLHLPQPPHCPQVTENIRKAELKLLFSEEEGLIESMKVSDEKSSASAAETFSEDGLTAMSPYPQLLPKAPVKSDRVYAGVAASLTTPSDFSVALEGLLLSMVEVSLLLDELVEKMSPLSEAFPGSFCLFQSEQQQKWCRTQIVSMDAAVVLNLIDYGYHECVPLHHMSKLKNLPEELFKFPKLTFSCSLRGVRPAGGQWSEEAIVFFKKLLCQKNLQIFFREHLSSSHWRVDVLADGVHAATELVNAGFAVYQENQGSGTTEDDGREVTMKNDDPPPIPQSADVKEASSAFVKDASSV